MTTASLATIPLLDIGAGGAPALLHADPERAHRLILGGREIVPPAALGTLDRLSRRWARRNRNPYYDEMAANAARLPTGAWFMNLCYEWGCTTGVAADPAGVGMRMLRCLDWPFPGVGREVVVARQEGPAGQFYNVTWPGFSGVVTAMCPGRFAVAINQAPLMRRGLWPWQVDWLIDRIGVYRSRDLPPPHLLRRVVETCTSYEEAKRMLAETPVALPVFFTLSGTTAVEGCVIERTERCAWIHEAPAAVANHWLTPELRGMPRGPDNRRRWRLMSGLCRTAGDGFGWMVDPIHNAYTRLAVVQNAATGQLLVRGWETDGVATEAFDLASRLAGSHGIREIAL